MSEQTPTPTVPNVVIRDPKARERIYDAVGILGLGLAVLMAVDLASPELDFAAWTGPALAGLGVLTAGIGYTARRNLPL